MGCALNGATCDAARSSAGDLSCSMRAVHNMTVHSHHPLNHDRTTTAAIKSLGQQGQTERRYQFNGSDSMDSALVEGRVTSGDETGAGQIRGMKRWEWGASGAWYSCGR